MPFGIQFILYKSLKFTVFYIFLNTLIMSSLKENQKCIIGVTIKFTCRHINQKLNILFK